MRVRIIKWNLFHVLFIGIIRSWARINGTIEVGLHYMAFWQPTSVPRIPTDRQKIDYHDCLPNQMCAQIGYGLWHYLLGGVELQIGQ